MKRDILKKAMSQKYCGETRFEYLDPEERHMIYKAMDEYHVAMLKKLDLQSVQREHSVPIGA